MERCSYFIPDKALFGSFPTQNQVDLLEECGVRCFIDLTNYDERKIIPYVTKYKYIKYPIPDRKIPMDWKSFAYLIIKICDVIEQLENNNKVYIHCKGGHGRSGILVACILARYSGLTADNALSQTNYFHSKRPEMQEKWRKLGSPQGKKQKEFVRRFFRPLYYGKDINCFNGFDNNTKHQIELPKLGIFPNAFFAFQAFRAPENKEYIEMLRQGKLCPHLVKCHTREWEEKKVHYMTYVLDQKIRQHPDVYNNLLRSGLRPLVRCSSDSFWGDGGNRQGKNIHGRILDELRVKYLRELYD